MRKAVLLLLLLSGLTIKPFKSSAQVNVQDSLALVDLYNSTGGVNWYNNTNWLTKYPVSTWYNVQTEGNRVAALLLYSNNLVGSIPSSLANLAGAEVITLNQNHLSGTIPVSLAYLPTLNVLTFDENDFTFAGIENLIKVYYNTGNVNYSPQAIIPLHKQGNILSVSAGGTLANNTYKWYSGNNLITTKKGDSTFTIPVPASGQYSVAVTNSIATQLTLYSDTLLPLVNVDSLALVDLYNSTNGTNWNKRSLDRPVNWLTDAPLNTWDGVTLDNSGRVKRLNLYGTGLVGIIPSSIGYLTNLDSLDLSFNFLTGAIPSSVSNLVNLNYLELSNNLLNDTIPSFLGSLVNLHALRLSNNHLTGNIPFMLGNLTNLTSLDLNANYLTGNIPPILGNLINLTDLALSYNQLTGSIPSTLGNLTNLRDLLLNNNYLSGSIPSSFGNFNKLNDFFSLSGNNLSGIIPTTLGTLIQNNDVYLFILENQFNFSGMEQLIQAYPKVNIAMKYGYDTSYYNNEHAQADIPLHKNGNTLSVSAGGTLSNNTYKWYNGNTLMATITGDSTFVPTRGGTYSVTVTNAIAKQLTLYSDTITPSLITIRTCENYGADTLISNVSGTNYQWQENNGSGFTNDVNSQSRPYLDIIFFAPYTAQNGVQYRCIVDGKDTSQVYTIEVIDTWTGSVSSAWEDTRNWACGSVPDTSTNVYINSGTPPVILSSNTTVRSITVSPNASVTIVSPFNLTVIH